MIPTIHDVVGAPVPGTNGVRDRTTPRDAQQFRQLLQQLLGNGATTTSAPSSVTPGSRVRPGHATPVRVQPHTPALHRVPAVRGTSRATAPRRVATTAAKGHAPGTRAALASAIRQAAAAVGVEPALSVGVARVESNLNPAARSPDGASHGTFQVTHATAAAMRHRFATGAVARPAGTDDVALGVGYLRYLHDLFGRSATLGKGLSTTPVADAGERKLFAVAAFNAGEGRVAQAQARARAAGQDPTRFANVRPYLPAITRTYVERVASTAREEAASTEIA